VSEPDQLPTETVIYPKVSSKPGAVQTSLNGGIRANRPATVRAVSLGTALGLIVSLLALVATMVVGLLRFKHERMLDDRADARLTLSAGALELGRMGIALKDALTAFTQPLETDEGWLDDFEIGMLETAAEALQSSLAGVRIRFKQDSDVVLGLDGALAATQSLMDFYFRARESNIAGGGRREQRDRSDYSEAMTFILEFHRHRDDYLFAAQKVVGVDLSDE
jgi:hypothetical protein